MWRGKWEEEEDMKQMTENILLCRYTNRQSAEVLVLEEPSRIESAILGILRMVQFWRGIQWGVLRCRKNALSRNSGLISCCCIFPTFSWHNQSKGSCGSIFLTHRQRLVLR